MKALATALTGTQKVAVVLMQLNQGVAASVMKQFSEAEAHEVAAEIVRLHRVEPKLVEKVLAEFHQLATSGRRPSRGGRDLAVGLLEASFGMDKAAGVLNRIASTIAGKSFEFLESAEPNQIAALVDGEHPQTIALVLAHLRADRASAVLSALSENVRTDVAQSLATMGTATPEAVSVVADTLKSRAGAMVAAHDTPEVVGGVQPLVEILNRSDVSTERSLLEGLEERDPELAEEVRSRLLTFADIVKLDRRDIQQVLRGVDPVLLAIAMKGAPEPVLVAIRANISERNREILESEISNSGPVRASQVEEARADIVRAIRELEAQGAITVRRGEEEDLVY